MFANIVWPPKMANIPLLCSFDTNLIIRWQSWQTCLKAKMLANIPPHPWGADRRS